jgi:Na+-transporting NADH:ubiquinone oxidoreductase subunit NqrC
MLQAITTRLRKFKSRNRGISTVIVVMLSLVLITIIVGNVVLWSYQMNQIDLDRMHETVTITDVSKHGSSGTCMIIENTGPVSSHFVAKIVTERGNIAIFSEN